MPFYIIYALIGLVFTSLTTITIKIGLNNINSRLATLFRTLVVLIFSFLLCLITGALKDFNDFNSLNYLFLILSGIATAVSWLFYNKAIKVTSINIVAPIDKTSFVYSMILFLIFFFDETTSNGDVLVTIKIILASFLLMIGSLLMISKKDDQKLNHKGIVYAFISALSAALVTFLVKLGLKGVNTNNATLVRTIVVLITLIIPCLINKDFKEIKKTPLKSYLFLLISGVFTFISWLSEYQALNELNSNPIVCSIISKSAIILTCFLSFIIFKEKYQKKSLLGLLLIFISLILTIFI